MKRDVSVVALSVLGVLLVSAASRLILGHSEWIATVAAVALMATLACLWIYRRILRSLTGWYRTMQYQTWQQIQSLLSLFSVIHVTHPLPPMRGAAILPDLANVLLSLILERKPGIVVEVGSGVSTLIIAYALRHVGQGNLISLEHEHTYFARTMADLTKHGLTDIAAVVYAPLQTVTINGARWRWYDTTALATAKRIDLVFVDGPPGNTQKLARYPALPLLIDKLAEGAVILLDDVNRDDEQLILRKWTTQFPDFNLQFIDTFKKAAILRRTADRESQKSEKD